MAGTRTASLSAEKKVKQRARILANYEVTKNVSATCRYFGISRTTFISGGSVSRPKGSRGSGIAAVGLL